MNFLDKLLLRFFLLPTSLYRKAGVDILQLRAILTAKLTMDNRRPTAFKSMKQTREKKEVNRATLGTVFGSLIMGLFFLYSFGIGDQMITKLTLYFSMFIFMVSIMLITDFTSVLIDVRDNFIILPKPVTDATFVLARLLHIAIRTCLIVVPLFIPAWITTVVMAGAGMIFPFLLMIMLSTLFSIFLINAVYILILKITTPAKFQSIINYIQIGFAIIVYGGFQILPRMITNKTISGVNISELPFIRFYPPFWFADSSLSIAQLNFSSNGMINVMLALCVPVIAVWVVVRYFAPSFNQKLSMISSGNCEQSNKAVSPASVDGKKARVSRLELLAAKLTRSGSEYMGFLFAWKMMSRSRDFKMKVYPSFGYVIVFMVMMVINHPSLIHPADGSKGLLPGMLLLVYFSSFVLISVLQNLPYSEKFKAAWIFNITPVNAPGEIICGAVKAAIVCFYIPIVLVLCLLGTLILGPGVIPNLLLGCFNVLSISSLIAYISTRKLPFSSTIVSASKGATFLRGMLTLLVPAIFGGIHWLVSGHLWFVIFLLIIAVLIPWLVLDEVKKLGWEKIEA